MKLVRYNPWGLLGELQHEMNRLFEQNPELEVGDDSSVVTSNWAPAVDIHEHDDRFVLYADIPGVDPSDIEVSMDKGVLSIKGERSSQTDEEKDGFRRVERIHGTFYRRFTLPDTADADNIKATGKDGVLEIVIPKREQEQPRRIEVKA